MLLQEPMPPTPPEGPPFDPNLIFLEGGPGFVIIIVLAALTACTIILWPIVRAFARRLEGKVGDPALKAEVDHLQARLGEVDSLQARVAELEERVDFAERLLAQPQQSARLGGPAEGTGR
jgi:hypothetical protein